MKAARATPLMLVPLAFLALFFFYPLVAVVVESFAPDGQLNLAPLASLWREPYFGRALWFTTWQATLSTVVTLALGMPVAFVFARYSFRGKTFLRALTTIPFVLPAMVVAAAFTALLGPRGWLNTQLMAWFDMARAPIRLQQTIWLVLLAHAFYNTTVIVRIVGGFWSNLDNRLSEAGRVLGGSRPRVFFEITLPLLLPAVAAAGLLVFLFCFTSFGVILILGGPRFATLEVEIYRQAVALFRLPEASAIALAQIVLTFVVMAVYTRAQARASLPLNLRPAGLSEIRPTTPLHRLLVGLTAAGVLLFLVAPLAALALRSLAPGDPLRYFRELFVNRTSSLFYVPPGIAIRNSVAFALLTTGLALTIGTLTATLMAQGRTRWTILLEPLVLLPLGTSAVTLGFGYLLTMGQPPLNLRASPVLVPIAHTLVAFPLRRPHPAARDARDQARLAGGGRDLGCFALARLARDRPADRGPRAARCGPLRLHRQHGRVRRHAPDRAARVSDHAPGDLPPAGPARRAQLRPGHGHEHHPDVGLCGRVRPDRALPRRPGRRVLTP